MAKEVKEKKVTKSTNDIQSDFNKRFGEGTLFSFEDEDVVAEVYPISMGIPTLDYALGIGGLPLGRIVEIYGPESAGKTSVTLMAIAKFQELAKKEGTPIFGKRAAYVDAEHSLDPVHMRNLGVDLSKSSGLLINQPDSGEQAFDLMEAMILSDQFGMIAVDSVPSLVPMKAVENGAEYIPMADLARLMSFQLRKIAPLAHKHNVLLIFINQVREKPGVMHGPSETQPGGRSLKFYSSVRLDVRRKPIEKSGMWVGQETKIKVVKNKVSRPFTIAEYDYYFDSGVDLVKNIMNVATEEKVGVIKRAGAYYYIGEDSKNPYTDGSGNVLKWQGKEALLETLRVSPGLFQYINDMVMGVIPKDAQMVSEATDEETEPTEEDLLAELPID